MPNKWHYLKSGDIIDIVATTPGIKKETLNEDLEFLSSLLHSINLVPRYNLNALFEGADFFSDHALNIRKQNFYEALFANDSKAIWFIRGGYGTSKLLKDLSKNNPPKHPKLLIGYSDINTIHLWVNKFWNWSSLHARILYEFLNQQNISDFELTAQVILGKSESISFDNLLPLNKAAQTSQIIRSSITGGTIQVLQSGIGLDWQFIADNKILFFEEIFDRGVRIERTLYHFSQLGLLKKAKAILFGDIVCGSELDGTYACDAAIKYFASSLDIPVLSITNIGHNGRNMPLPLNTSAELILSNSDAKLICSTGGLA